MVPAHLSLTDLQSYLAGQLNLTRENQIRSHVLQCAGCETALVDAVTQRLAGVASPGTGHRAEPRVQCATAGSIQSLAPLSLETQAAEIVDTSVRGAGIKTNAPFAPGMIVVVRKAGQQLIGTVRNCAPLSEGGFRIGVELRPADANYRAIGCEDNVWR